MTTAVQQLPIVGGEKPVVLVANHVVDQETPSKPLEQEPTLLRSKFADHTKWQILRTFWRLTLTGLAVSLGGMYAGYCISAPGNIVANQGFINQFGTVQNADGTLALNALHVSLWSGFVYVAQITFQFISPFISDYLGRRTGLYCFLLLMMAAVVAELTARDWKAWMAGRILSGASQGFLGSSVMVYLSEIAVTQIRGALLGAFALCFALGQFFIAVGLQIIFVNSPLLYRNALYSQFVIFGVFAAVLLYIPESPAWLCRVGKHGKAKRALKRLVGNVEGYDIEHEYAVLQQETNESAALAAAHGGSDWVALFKWANFKRVIAATLPFTYQNVVGVPLIYGQTTYFFQIAGLKDPFIGKTCQTVVQIVGLIAAFYFVEKVGRRTLVLGGPLILAGLNFVIGGMGFVPNSPAVGSALISLFCIWTFVYALCLAPIGWTALVEVSSPRLRAKTAAAATALQTLSGILFSYTVPLMLSPQYAGWRAKIGLLFGGLTLIYWIPCYFLFPECKDRTYQELDELYASGVPVRQFAKTRTTAQMAREQTTA